MERTSEPRERIREFNVTTPVAARLSVTTNARVASVSSVYSAAIWMRATNFVDLVPQKRRLLLTLNMRFNEVSDPRGLATDITNLGLWGNGDVQVELDNEREIAYAMELVRQAFASKQLGGDTSAS